MIHLPELPSYMHSVPLVSLVIVGGSRYLRKIVRAFSDFAVYLFREIGRAIREFHKLVDEVHRGREKAPRRPQFRGRRPTKTPPKRVTQESGKGRSRQKRGDGGNVG
jgi:hypothetical protein